METDAESEDMCTLREQLEKQTLWQLAFPWVPLITSDYNILLTSCNSLQNPDAIAFTSSCEFLKNVILEDFPAEVLLQRPFIVETLLDTLSSPLPVNYSIVISALQCLVRLTSCLLGRLATYQDPAFYVPENNATSTLASQLHSLSNAASQHNLFVDPHASINTINDVRYSGDGQDGDMPSLISDRRSTDRANLNNIPPSVSEDVESSQKTQLTLPLFCIKIFKSCLKLLNGHSLHITNLVAQLSKLVFKLMRNTFNPYVWFDTTGKAYEVKASLTASFQAAGELLHYHKQRFQGFNTKKAVKHRYVYLTLAYITCGYLENSLHVKQAKEYLPGNLTAALADLIFDAAWKISFPRLHTLIISYIREMDIVAYETYVKVKSIIDSLAACCVLNKKLTQERMDIKCVLELAEKCLVCLPYVNYSQLITRIVSLCMESASNARDSRSETLLLALLSYPVKEIRIVAYQACFDFLHSILDTKSVLTESWIWQLKGFIAKPLLEHLCFHGLVNENPEVNEISENIFLCLMQCWQQLPDKLVEKLREIMFSIFPVLQGFTCPETPLGRCLLKLIEDNNFLNHPFSSAEKLKLCFRLLFCRHVRTRLESLSKIISILAEENQFGSPDLLLELSESSRKNVSGLLIVEPTNNLYLKQNAHLDTSDKVPTMKTYLGIAKKGNTEKEIKTSALHQLAILLEDQALHSSFVEENGFAVITECLHSMAEPNNWQNESGDNDLFVVCTKILTMLAFGSSSYCQELSSKVQLYDSVFKSLILRCNNTVVRTAAAQFFAMLVFCEAIVPSKSGEDGAIYGNFKSSAMLRYSLPFKVDMQSMDMVPAAETLNAFCHPVTCSVIVEQFVRLSWNLAYFDSPLKYISADLDHFQHVHKDWPQILRSNEEEQELLKSTFCDSLVEHNLSCLACATTHKEAYSSLHALTLAAFLYENDFITNLQTFSWPSAFNKFFQIIPSCKQDEDLFGEVLSFFTVLLHSPCSLSEELLLYLWEKVSSVQGPVQSHLQRLGRADTVHDDAETATNFRYVTCQLLTFLSSLVASTTDVLSDSVSRSAKYSDLVHTLSIGLNLTGSPHFYNISHLEKTLTCLVHLTAGPHWSLENAYLFSSELCERLLQVLKEVVAAFHLGSPGSYMGKGVICTAALCLRHIAEEMKQESVQGWESLWLHPSQPEEHTDGDPRLDWLIPLLFDKNPEVRAAGLGVLVCLSSTDEGGLMVISQVQHLLGGAWIIGLTLLLEHREPSIVREQAAWLLCNLTSRSEWLSSIARLDSFSNYSSEDNLRTESSSNELQTLLKHKGFYLQVEVIIKNCYVCSKLYLLPKTKQEDESLHFLEDRGDTFSFGSEDLLSSRQDEGRESSGIGISTPPLVSAVCHLLRNLLILDVKSTGEAIREHGILFSLLQFIDISARTLDDPQLVRQEEIQELNLSVISLVEASALRSRQLRQDLLNHSFVIEELIKLLINCTNNDKKLRMAAYKVFICLLQPGDNISLCYVISALQKYWIHFVESLKNSLEQPETFEESVLVQKLMSHLFVCEKLRQNTPAVCQNETPSLVHLFDNLSYSSDDNVEITAGKSLSQTMMALRNKINFPQTWSESDAYESINGTLQCLLLVSSTAKTAAIEGNLIVELIKEIENAVKYLTVESIQKNEKYSVTKLGEAVFPSLITRLQLLQTIMYKNNNAKTVACKHDFGSIMHRLWSFGMTNKPVMAAVLSTLCAYTANSPISCKSLACSSSQRLLSSNSLVHCVIKHTKSLLEKKVSKTGEMEILTLMFQLLTTLSTVNRCRSIIAKMLFVEQFLVLFSQLDQKSRSYQTVEKLWLDFLVAITTSPEGQFMIISVKGVLDQLYEIVSSGNITSRISATLALRNLCHHSSAKKRILSAGFVVPLAFKLLREQTAVSPIAASILWVLVSNFPKAKGILRSSLSWETDLIFCCQKFKLASTEDSIAAAEMLENVIKILQAKE